MNFNSQEKYYFWLAMTQGVGIKTIARIMENYPDLSELFSEAKARNRLRLGLPENTAEKLRETLYKRADAARLEDQIDYINRKEIKVLTYISDDYPSALREIYSPPSLLFARGDISCLSGKLFGIVGTRHATRRGIENSSNIARELAENGVTVVSGMAMGIDTAAHMGALSGGGKTAAVLGCGVDIVYPQENERLYYDIIDNGVVLSESLPGTKANPKLFPPRNRIITGLSSGVLVSEGDMKSGASITANFALEQNRDVFALPADIALKQGKLPNSLIFDGAVICLGAETILDFYRWKNGFGGINQEKEDFPELDFLQTALYNLLLQGDMSLEEITNKTDCTVSELMEALTMLEILGIIEKQAGNIFRVLR